VPPICAKFVNQLRQEGIVPERVCGRNLETLRFFEELPFFFIDLLADHKPEEVQEALLVGGDVTGGFLVDDLNDRTATIASESREVGLGHEPPASHLVEPFELALSANRRGALVRANLIGTGDTGLDSLPRFDRLVLICDLLHGSLDDDLTLLEVRRRSGELDGLADDLRDVLFGGYLTAVFGDGLTELLATTQEEFHLLVRECVHESFLFVCDMAR
jgi:hypothetical protein